MRDLNLVKYTNIKFLGSTLLCFSLSLGLQAMPNGKVRVRAKAPECVEEQKQDCADQGKNQDQQAGCADQSQDQQADCCEAQQADCADQGHQVDLSQIKDHHDEQVCEETPKSRRPSLEPVVVVNRGLHAEEKCPVLVNNVNLELCRRSDATAHDLKTLNGLANTYIEGLEFGHRNLTLGSIRTLKWDNSMLRNVMMSNIKAGSMNAHHADWQGFHISGSIYDWEFKDAHLENGRFSGELEGVNFNNAHLKNITFSEAKLADAKRKGFRRTTFVGATLENVSFEGADLHDVSFKGATFRGHTSFRGSKIHFNSVFKGAKIETADGKFVPITTQVAEQFEARYHLLTNWSFIANDVSDWINNL